MARGIELGSKQIHSTPAGYEVEWMVRWKSAGLFEARPDSSKTKFFVCVPYSYQNGPLHLGHGYTFTRGDAIARYKRMRGFNVLFPWAWHWTGEAVAGTSERLRRGDESVIRMLREMDGVPEDLIPLFQHPPFICAYYTAENREIVDMMGWSVDWSREFYTTSLHPYYSKFITWQYETLKKRGLVVMGRHPVVWCPACMSATGDHDRLSGEGIYPEEYTLVYFSFGEYKLAAATLRPETIFGATNLWVNPEAEYVRIEHAGTKLIVSRRAAEKLNYQWDGLEVLSSVSPEELIGKSCVVPITGAEIPILPARFVDPAVGTGVVYSVPAHAPYDYVALKELQSRPELIQQYGITADKVSGLKPVSIISLAGYGEFPAVGVVEKLGILDQMDERLEDVTREIYSEEFHKGLMKEWLGEYGGLTVSQARKAVTERLVSKRDGAVIYDLSGKVVCRSGDECVVKVVEDQWFLRFSDEGWKDEVRNLIHAMNVYPPAARQWFLNVVEWLRDWACTRKSGLGTSLPWDESWIVETLSDSTIYPALYTVSKYLNADKSLSEKITPDAFGYIFLGEGDATELSEKTGVPRDILEKMRDEFSYWYPVDLRVSAKDLVPNHLTFYLFHHTGIFPRHLWPRGVSVNGLISIEGSKMSKSRGNFISLKQAIAKYGADATRLTLLLSAEDLDDPDWREKNVIEVRNFLTNFLEIVGRSREIGSGGADEWLVSMMHLTVKKVTEAMERMKTRTAAGEVVYGMLNIWRWWLRRGGGRMGRMFLENWIKVLAPFAPFTAEEAWRKLGKTGFISAEHWPDFDPSMVDLEAVMVEEAMRDLIDDVREILKVVKGEIKEILIYKADEWKVGLARSIIGLELGEAVRAAAKKYDDRKRQLSTLVTKIIDIIHRYEEKIKRYSEVAGFGDPSSIVADLLGMDGYICSEAAKLLEGDLKIPVTVIPESESAGRDPVGKAASALPLRPALYVSVG
ncbi:MAG: leucine--tRNA ligase [Nitrososphaerota archaeon]